MNVKDNNIGQIVSLNNSSIAPGIHVAGKILAFHKGPNFTDVDVELADGSVINTFNDNLNDANVIDFVGYQIAKSLSFKEA